MALVLGVLAYRHFDWGWVMWGPMSEYGWNGMGGFGLWGGLMMVLGWGVLIILIAGVVKWLFGNPIGHAGHLRESPKRALDILEERYARGEIDREEYLQRRDDLK